MKKHDMTTSLKLATILYIISFVFLSLAMFEIDMGNIWDDVYVSFGILIGTGYGELLLFGYIILLCILLCGINTGSINRNLIVFACFVNVFIIILISCYIFSDEKLLSFVGYAALCLDLISLLILIINIISIYGVENTAPKVEKTKISQVTGRSIANNEMTDEEKNKLIEKKLHIYQLLCEIDDDMINEYFDENSDDNLDLKIEVLTKISKGSKPTEVEHFYDILELLTLENNIKK